MKNYYRVRRGDNLISIARRFGVGFTKIKKVNNIPGTKIYPGQVLKVVF